VDTRALRYFQAVAECGSYSRGSELLRISQPAISRTIRKLEDDLGSPLFRRHGHGVTLTEAGRILLERSQAILRQFEQARAEIRGSGGGPSGVISLAVPPAAGQFLAPPLVERFGAAYPRVLLKIIAGYSGTIHEWLVRGQVDLACAHDPLPQRGFEVVPLVEEEVLLVGRPGSAPHMGGPVTPGMMADLRLVLPSRPNASRRLLDLWVANSGVPLNVGWEVDDHSITRALVRQGIGFTLLTRGGVEPELRRGELKAWPLKPRASWSLAMISNTSLPRSDVLMAFMRMLREVARDLVASGRWPGRSLDGALPSA
jgi:LysR family transcriptional regulator, nitrogen assimilation regulatory protein